MLEYIQPFFERKFLLFRLRAFKATISQEPFFDTEAGYGLGKVSFAANSNDFSIRLTGGCSQ